MGFSNMDRFISMVPEEISDDEKENLFSDLCSAEVTVDLDQEFLVKIFKISQEILKFKGEQVESLITELDALATKLGEEEAKQNQSLIEMEEFHPATGGKSESANADDLNRKLMKMEIQKNHLIAVLQEKEVELINEKKESENLSNKLFVLEEENKNLKGELQSIQQELASTASLKLISEDQDYFSMDKYHELSELLRQKNKHITQLLNDIEDTERENIILRDKLSIVRDELQDGAEQMSKLSMERISLSTTVDELNGKVLKLEQENIGLRNQISELIIDKETRDKQFENLSSSYESKIQQWKELLQMKEIELSSAKYRQSSGTSNQKFDETSHLDQLSNLSQTLAEREEKILELQQQLEQATADLNENTRLLEDQKILFQSKFDRNFESNNIKQLRKQLDQAETRITVLEAKVKYAEEESLRKAEEVSELIIQLREYESGTYGLEDAMTRIKDLQKQKQVRDIQIEQLVQSLNELQDEDNFLEHENQILREKLGIAPGEEIVPEDFSRRNLRKQNKISILNQELEKHRNDLVELKLENRKLNQQITSLISELNFYRLKEPLSGETNDSPFLFDQDESARINRTQALMSKSSSVAIQSGEDELFLGSVNEDEEEKLKTLIDENESLRKGMHEILDSIRNQDGCSLIRIESETLERLLEALDVRHVSGWYQPAMRLQAHIHHLYGVNEALREELHIYRLQEEKLLLELQHTGHELKSLQKNVTQFTPEFIPPLFQQRMKTAKLKKAASCSEESFRVHENDKELILEREKIQKLEAEIKNRNEKFQSLEKEMNKVHQMYDQDKESWCVVKTAMQEEIDNLRNSEAILQIKINDFELCMEAMKGSPEQINKTLVEMTLSMSSLKVEHEQLTRKYQRLLEMENQIRQEKNKVSNEIYSLRFTKDQEIIDMRRTNEQLNLELKELMSLLSESVRQQDHGRVLKDFKELTVKYRESQQKQIFLQSQKDQLVVKLQNEVASLLSQKIELEFCMRQILEEVEMLRYSTSNNSVSEEVTILSKRTADLELEITSTIQQSQHWNRMYELIKEQLTEMENRCKQLEEQLLTSVQVNAELQKSEAILKEEILKLPTALEYETLLKQLKDAESNVADLRLRENELQELASIAQDQVKVIEHYNRYQDFEYDSLQRRILELQSLSDEKMIIDRLTKELLLLQQNGINANHETNNFKDKLAKRENEILQLKMKLNEAESNFNKLKRDTSIKIKYMHAIIYELQKRYLGSYPLVKEELCVKSLVNYREECIVLMSVILDLKPPSVLKFEDKDGHKEILQNKRKANTKGWQYRSEFNVEDFSLKLINEGLQNKLQIYTERLGRQDKLINRLEEEIVHADEQCQEFLLYWNPNGDLKFNNRTGENTKTKSTQTVGNDSIREIKVEAELSRGEPADDIHKTSNVVQELNADLRRAEEEVRSMREKLNSMAMELQAKELIISNREKEISLWQKVGSSREEDHDKRSENNDSENSIRKLALQTTVDSLQNIINQKEEIIARQQNMIRKNGEEHAQNILELVREIKALQNALELKQQAYNRLKIKLDVNEKPPNEKRSIIDSYLTKMHELEDELNQANEKVEQLSNQLLTSNQQAELWSHTAEERLKSLQNMKNVMDTKPRDITTENIVSYASLTQSLKEKCDEIERLQRIVDEHKRQEETGKKLLTNRDRVKSELERYKRKVDILEQREKEDKAEIQRLKNKILSRPQSVCRKEVIVSPREEQLMKKIKFLEDEVNTFKEKEKKWKELRQTKVDEEIGKWQHKKQYQQNFEKLRQQLKDQTVQCESLALSNARLKETIIRLEKERIGLESKLKAAKSQVGSISLMEELQKANSRLEQEVEVLRKSAQFSMGSTSLTSVIEAQERKIKALEIAQKGNSALSEEVERLNERKSQLQKYNVRLEEENLQLKLEIERIKSSSQNLDELLDSTTQRMNAGEFDDQFKGNCRRNNLEKAVLVLRRLVEKLQAENKRLHSNRASQIQEQSSVDKLNAELQNLQKNYLSAIEKTSTLDKELKTAYQKIDSLQKLIDRFHKGEEVSLLNSQISQKNHLLIKVKNLLEKAASREKELLLKVQDLQKLNEITC